jgi:Tol biopolymer transport system component
VTRTRDLSAKTSNYERKLVMRRLTVTAVALALLSVPAALAASATGSPPTASADQARSVTNGRLAFLANTAEQRQLFTIKPDGSDLTQLTHVSGGSIDYGDAWAPDGSSLLYVVSATRDVIYRIASDGSGARKLSPPCTDQCLGDDYPDYNHTGTKIAFERTYGPIKNNSASGGSGIYTMNSDGTGLRQLTQRSESHPSEDHKATWSPDGNHLAFARLNDTAQPKGLAAIFVVDANGGDPHRLTPWPLIAGDPKWSPDGTRILFNSYDQSAGEPPIPGKGANLYTIRADGTDLKQLTHYTGGRLQAFADDWSPDGKQIVFHLTGDAPNGTHVDQLFAMSANGTDVRQLTHLNPAADPELAVWGTAN